MFRIRRVLDDALSIDERAIAQVQETLRSQFADLREADVRSLPDKLRKPHKYRFRHLLFVADDGRGSVKGFALVSHEPELNFCFLDYLATGRQLSGAGVGGALYQWVREEARALGSTGLLFESAPDDPAQCPSPEVCKANVARLRFYERFGARPIEGTAYESGIEAGEHGYPHLMYDDLDRGRPLRRNTARRACRAILEHKYGHLCSTAYIDRVVASFHDDPVRLRAPRHANPDADRPVRQPLLIRQRIMLVVNDRHDIHHVRDRGYVEAPVRIGAILKDLAPTGLFHQVEPRHFSEAHIRAVHDARFVDYLRRACENTPPGKSLYPYVFPIRNATRPPRELTIRAGYYCIDTFTPLNANAYLAATRAVDCALTAARAILRGARLAYALVRPPGHHAERRSFGGFCYFNNAAIAAQHLCGQGRVAILDVDYHHGNGQQDIFYERPDVLTVSIHGHPRFAYPYFSGFEEERGSGPGTGFNVNYPLPEALSAARYRQVLERALGRIRAFGPTFLVVALGLDTARGDPTGTWSLSGGDFAANGRLIGAMRMPTLIVQEGGYRTRTLGSNARHFLTALTGAAYGLPPGAVTRPPTVVRDQPP